MASRVLNANNTQAANNTLLLFICLHHLLTVINSIYILLDIFTNLTFNRMPRKFEMINKHLPLTRTT